MLSVVMMSVMAPWKKGKLGKALPGDRSTEILHFCHKNYVTDSSSEVKLVHLVRLE
jgi:hypothetical protein